jgi:hypothetical protein
MQKFTDVSEGLNDSVIMAVNTETSVNICQITQCIIPDDGRLGGVMVSVLATRPKRCVFDPGQGDGFLKPTKIRSTPSSRMGRKVAGPMS